MKPLNPIVIQPSQRKNFMGLRTSLFYIVIRSKKMEKVILKVRLD